MLSAGVMVAAEMKDLGKVEVGATFAEGRAKADNLVAPRSSTDDNCRHHCPSTPLAHRHTPTWRREPRPLD